MISIVFKPDRFEDPRVLPCQHTFCLKPCMEKLYDTNSGHIKCPLCRVVHRVPRGLFKLLDDYI